jgi:REP element-mobilizing transposase RayT
MKINGYGQVIEDCWSAIPIHFPGVSLDEFVVMPNHLHGIVIIGVGATHASPGTATYQSMSHQLSSPQTRARHASPLRDSSISGSLLAHGPKPKSLAAIVGSFKSAAAKRINLLRRTPGALLWQRNYYEHVIRNEAELSRIREYIVTNPARWEFDSENPNRS